VANCTKLPTKGTKFNCFIRKDEKLLSV